MRKKTPYAITPMGFFILAPRPGLEPGTYGLTEIQVHKKHL